MNNRGIQNVSRGILMKVFGYIAGSNLDNLINYVGDVNKDHVIEHAVNGIWFRQKIPNPFSIPLIMMLLIFSFLVPLETASLTFRLPPSIAVSITYPLTLSIMVVIILAIKSVLKGSKWSIMVFKYVFVIDCLLFLLSLYFSLSAGNIRWELLIVTAGMLLWCRVLLNCTSFSTLVKFYLHRKLVASGINDVLEKQNNKK